MRAAAALAAACLAALPVGAEEAAPRPVVSVIVSPRTDLPVGHVGTVVARIEADLGFPLAGRLAERPVEIGDLVRRGDAVARLDPEQLEADLRAAEAGVAVARAQLRSARDAAERARALVERGVGTRTRLEDAERALVAAEARLDQAEATRNRAADLLALATLRAPHDGVVTAVRAEPGAAVSAGQPVLSLAATAPREIVIDMTERDAAALTPGTEFLARLVVDPDITARATLDRIDPVAAPLTRTLRVHLALADPPAGFRLGALVAVEPLQEAAGGIVLPRTALVETSDGPAVWVVDRPGGRVRLVPVAIAGAGEGFAVVRAGLVPGDEVVVRGVHSLREGQMVGPRYPG